MRRSGVLQYQVFVVVVAARRLFREAHQNLNVFSEEQTFKGSAARFAIMLLLASQEKAK
jgi:hypothetical protein